MRLLFFPCGSSFYMATDSHIPRFDLNCRKFYHMSAKNFKGHHMVMTLNLSCTGILSHIYFLREAWCPGYRASDCKSRGPGFESHKGHSVVPLSNTYNSPQHWLILRKWWFRPDMSEKLLTGTLNANTNKQNIYFPLIFFKVN